MRINGNPHGAVWLPPSKSYSHRALLAGALAGHSRIDRLILSQDTRATLNGIAALGGEYAYENDRVQLHRPMDGGSLLEIDCGESGSTLRFLIPIAAALRDKSVFVGHGRLMERPLAPYEQALGSMLRFTRDGQSLTVEGRLYAGDFEMPGDVSSQFITGLLFALPLLDGDSTLTLTTPLQSRSYVDLTLDVLRQFGIAIQHDDYRRFTVTGNQTYRPTDYTVEGDFSAAAFFLVAGALGTEVECCGLNEQSMQGDRAILDHLRTVGATVAHGANGGLTVSADRLVGVTIDVSDCPDLVPPLAALLAFCEGESRLVGAARLRITESDRLASVTAELTRLGAHIEEFADHLVFHGVNRLHGGDCLAWNDHRIAMMVAIAALRADGEVTVDNPACVSKSYPQFWEDYQQADF